MHPFAFRPLAIVLLLAGIGVEAALSQPPQPQPQPPPPKPGWTQIDVTYPGHKLDAPYKGKEGTATFDIYVKDATGKYVKKTITVEIKKDKSVTDMAGQIKTRLDALLEEHCYFYYNIVGNSVTIWPTDSAADPDKEGSPGSYPSDKEMDAKVRKETHPLKK